MVVHIVAVGIEYSRAWPYILATVVPIIVFSTDFVFHFVCSPECVYCICLYAFEHFCFFSLSRSLSFERSECVYVCASVYVVCAVEKTENI